MKKEIHSGVTVDPAVCFGEPYLTGRGITCMAIVSCFQGGDDVDAIASWYNIETFEVEAALRWSLLSRAMRAKLIKIAK